MPAQRLGMLACEYMLYLHYMFVLFCGECILYLRLKGMRAYQVC
jgi:hypothetical protein